LGIFKADEEQYKALYHVSDTCCEFCMRLEKEEYIPGLGQLRRILEEQGFEWSLKGTELGLEWGWREHEQMLNTRESETKPRAH